MSDTGGTDTSDDACNYSPITDYNQSLNIGAVFVILFASLLGTSLPLLAKHYPAFAVHPFVYIVGKHVGTGVLLALSLIHLLAPAFDELGDPCLPSAWQNYEYAPLFALLAALAMHFIEVMALELTHAFDDVPEGSTIIGTVVKSPQSNHGGIELCDVSTVTLDQDKTDTTAINAVDADKVKDLEMGALPAQIASSSSSSDFEVVKAKTMTGGHSHGGGDHVGHSHSVLLGNDTDKTIAAYILEFGLTSHSVIIGITVGVAAQSDLNSLLPALCFHQFFEGFALGARLADVGFHKWNEFILLCIYSFSAPLGIAIGIGIVNSYNGNGVTANLIEGTFDAVSAGILLYVAFAQMLAIEFTKDYRNCGKNKYKKLALWCGMYIGAGVMALIGKWL